MLLDHRGNPINANDLEREHAGATAIGIRSIWRQSRVKGLTPEKLARILRAADASNMADEYLILAEEMEEKDLHYASVLGTRKRAVTRLKVNVEAPTDDDADVERAEFVARVLRPRAFKGMLFDALDALAKGYAGIEIEWDLSGKRWRPKSYRYRDPRFFRLDMTDMERPRLLTDANMDPGVELPAYKFIWHTPKIKSGAPLRSGIAKLVAFGWMCKTYSFKDWMAFAEVYGMPLRLGRYHPGASEEDIRVLKEAISQLGHDAGAVIPESLKIEIVEAVRATSATGAPVFAQLCEFINSEVSKGVLGHAASSDATPGRLGNDSNATEVREDVRDHDAEQLSATIQRDLVVPLIDLNFGPMDPDAYPVFSLVYERPEDLKAWSDAIVLFVKEGLRVEAQQIRDRFGLDMPDEDAEIIGEKKEPAPTATRPHLSAGSPPDPGDGDGPGSEEEIHRATRAIIHALGGVRGDEIDALTDGAASEWHRQMDPMVKKLLAHARACKTYGDFAEGLDEVMTALDASVLADRLATATFKARGLGDARDSAAEVHAVASPDLVELMARTTMVQTLIFDRDRFTKAEAQAWCRAHGFNDGGNPGVDTTETSYRIRQRDPGDFVDGTFRTITITDGVKAVVGRLKG